MTTLLAWIKHNKLASVLLVIVVLLLLSQSSYRTQMMSQSLQSDMGYGGGAPMVKNAVGVADSGLMTGSFREIAPAPDVANRMVVTNSSLSLLVKDVPTSLSTIKEYVKSAGGYMVSSSINRPEEGGTGIITVRIPSEKLDETVQKLKGQAIKVVSENMDGYDVTDHFVDNEARLVILKSNLARFEDIMAQAKDVTEILKVQSEIFSLQAQIDSIVGQQKYLETTSKTSVLTAFLATDDLALPYAPADAWRADVIFKRAVRSLLGSVQSLGTLLIWVGVYAIIWLPILLIVRYIMKRRGGQSKI